MEKPSKALLQRPLYFVFSILAVLLSGGLCSEAILFEKMY